MSGDKISIKKALSNKQFVYPEYLFTLSNQGFKCFMQPFFKN